jgi:hypothetical protein
VGAGGATTDGEKLFPPPGVMFFSVGEGATGDVVVVVVGDGAGSSLVPQPAVSAPIAMIAPPPATNARRRAKRGEFMTAVPSYPRVPTNNCFASRRRCNANVNIMAQSEQTVW